MRSTGSAPASSAASGNLEPQFAVVEADAGTTLTA